MVCFCFNSKGFNNQILLTSSGTSQDPREVGRIILTLYSGMDIIFWIYINVEKPVSWWNSVLSFIAQISSLACHGNHHCALLVLLLRSGAEWIARGLFSYAYLYKKLRMWSSKEGFLITLNFVSSKFSITMIPWEIKNLAFSNDICVTSIVSHFQDIYLRGATPISILN